MIPLLSVPDYEPSGVTPLPPEGPETESLALIPFTHGPMYSNGYQTNTAGIEAIGAGSDVFERNVTEGVSGPSLDIAHQQLDEALNRVYKSTAFLRETADRVFGAPPKGNGTGNAEPNASGTLPGLIQKLSWLHAALTEVESQSARFGAL